MLVSSQVEKLQKLAEQKELEIQEIQYNKYKYLYDIAIKLLRKEKVLLYGGVAINELMKPDMKFYSDNALPDIDVFAVNAKQLANRVVKEFKNLGFNMASSNEALHENTFKVFVDGLQIADISDVEARTFTRLSRGSIKSSFGLRIVNPLFLQMSLHIMMSHPFDAHRWSKVYQRLVLFYKTFHPNQCNTVTQSEISIKNRFHYNDKLASSIKLWITQNEYISVGGSVLYNYLLDNESTQQQVMQWTGSTMYDLLVHDDVRRTAQEMVAYLNDPSLTVSNVYKGDLILPDHVFIMHKTHRLIGMYKSNTCTSYVDLHKVHVASFHTICQFYMGLMFSPYKHHNKKYIMCIVKMLSQLQVHIFEKQSKRPNLLLNQFVLDCYGPFESPITLKRKQIQRKMKK